MGETFFSLCICPSGKFHARQYHVHILAKLLMMSFRLLLFRFPALHRMHVRLHSPCVYTLVGKKLTSSFSLAIINDNIVMRLLLPNDKKKQNYAPSSWRNVCTKLESTKKKRINRLFLKPKYSNVVVKKNSKKGGKRTNTNE